MKCTVLSVHFSCKNRCIVVYNNLDRDDLVNTRCTEFVIKLCHQIWQWKLTCTWLLNLLFSGIFGKRLPFFFTNCLSFSLSFFFFFLTRARVYVSKYTCSCASTIYHSACGRIGWCSFSVGRTVACQFQFFLFEIRHSGSWKDPLFGWAAISNWGMNWNGCIVRLSQTIQLATSKLTETARFEIKDKAVITQP